MHRFCLNNHRPSIDEFLIHQILIQRVHVPVIDLLWPLHGVAVIRYGTTAAIALSMPRTQRFFLRTLVVRSS